MREGLMQPPAGMEMPGPQQQQPPAAAASDTMDPRMGEAPDSQLGGSEQASPEEQAQYEEAMDMVWGMLYSEGDRANEIVDSVVQGSGGDLGRMSELLGELGSQVMEKVMDLNREQGTVVSESVMTEIGIGILEEMFEIMEAANAIPTDDAALSDMFTVAGQHMMGRVGRDLSEQGHIDPARSQQMLHEMRGVASNELGVSEQELTPAEAPPEGAAPPPQGGQPV